MVYMTGETAEVVPTTEADAEKYNNFTRSYGRMSYDQLERILTPILVASVNSGRARAEREGFTTITGRINLHGYRSVEVKDCIQIIESFLKEEFNGVNRVCIVYHDTNNPSSPSQLFHANAMRDITYATQPA